MIDFVQTGILSVIQGATEYLPISSSAHLVLFPMLFDWSDQGLAFDIAVHVGTLFASILYFRMQLTEIVTDMCLSMLRRRHTAASRLGWLMVVASAPVALAGALLYNVVQHDFRQVNVIGWATLLFALLLWYADGKRRGELTLQQLTIKTAILIGLGQALAIIPGTSRSGITMTIALLLGFSRQEAARFAFLLAIPAIAMAGGWQSLQLLVSDVEIDGYQFGFAMFTSALVAYLCIHYFLIYIEKVGMLPFVLYRVLLAMAIFIFL